MPQAPAGSHSIAYEVAGTAGSPVVLIMGLGLPRGGWWRQMEALSGSHRVAAFDNRGVGGSGRPPGLWRIADMAADALAVMDRLGWADAHLTGISMGGMIAQELALGHPGRVRSLALVSTTCRGFGWLPSLRGTATALPLTFGRGATRLRALQRHLFSPAFLARRHREELTRSMAHLLGELPPPSTFLAHFRAVVRFRSCERLAALAGIPTLVIQPGEDVVIPPAESERLAAAIPGARLVRFPGSGHGVTAEEAEGVNRLLLEHYRAADGTRDGALRPAAGTGPAASTVGP